MKKKILYLAYCVSATLLVGCSQKSGETNPNHEHTYHMQYQSAASCEEFGKLVEKCDCGDVNTIIIPKSDHVFKEKIKEKATCDKDGIQVKKCPVCNFEQEEPIPALGHIWKTNKKTAPTCSQEGVEEKRCDRCKQETTESIPKKEHTFHKEIIEATCIAEGKEQNVCFMCHETVVLKTIPKGSHNYKSYEKVASTCTKEGLIEKQCQLCKYVTTQKIPKAEHTFEEEIEVATCTKDGFKRRACTGCDMILDEVVYKSTGHVFKSTKVKTETCTTPGKIEHVCEVCGEIDVELVPAVGHLYSTYEKAPTCTETGSFLEKCDYCAHVKQDTVIPALGHSFKELGRTESTCTKEGTIRKWCRVCYHAEDEKIPKANHRYQLVEENDEYQSFECIDCHSTKTDRK